MVAVCGSYLFACGKTSNMQLSQNNLSLQAIWLEVNWNVTDSSYSKSRWLIFFCCCFVVVIVLVSLLNRMFAFMLHSEHTTSCFMAKSVIWHKVTSKQDIVLFWTGILFNHLNVNMFFLFVFLSDCKYLLFLYDSDTLAGDFLSAQLIYPGKVELRHPLYDFRGKE